MVCKACGAVNPEGTKFCKICASSFESDSPEVYQSPKYVTPPAAEEPAQPGKDGWGFVRAPKWPKPEFKADSITEEDLSAFEQDHDVPASEQQDYTGYSPRHFIPSVEEDDSAPSRGNAPSRFSTAAGRASQRRDPADHYDDSNETAAPSRATVYSMNDEEGDYSPVAPKLNTAPVPYRTRQQAAKAPDYGYTDHRSRKAPSRRRPAARSRSNMRNTLFWAAAGVLGVVVIVLLLSLFTRNSGGIGAFISGIFSSSPVTRNAVVEPSKTEDGQPAYAITIYARNGSTVRFTAGTTQKDFPVTNGKIGVRIAEAMWIPQEPVDASPVMVTPDFKVISEDGTITPVEIDPIAIAVPSLTMTITSPQSSSVTTDSGKIQVAGTLSDPGAKAYINDQECTVDASGNFTGSYTLTQTGPQTVTIEGRKAGYVTARSTLTVDNSAAATTIALAEGGTLRGTAETFTVKGTMEPGSTITVTGDVTGEPVVDSAAGTFSFTANTPNVGQYSAVVTATKDGVSSTKEFHLEHAPDLDTYAQGAHAMDYARIVAAPTHSQAYKCVGTIEEIIEDGETILAKMDVGSGNMVVIEYHPNYPSAATIEVGDGKTYSIFAYPNGKHEASGLPLVYAWFVLKS
ncbi:MAG: hypothetical protein AAGU74_11455 [Bacillota bacterium]